MSGITQERMNVDFGPSPVPRDPQRARIGNALKNPSKHFAQYQRVDMSHPERNDKNQQIGYLIHAHCWVLLDHVIGHELIERNLRIFLNAITKFWKENHALWNPLLLDDDYDGTFYPIHQRLRETPQTTENNYIKMECVDTLQNPVIVPEIRALINQTVRACFENDDRSARPRQTVAFDVPLEIAMMIVNVIYDNIYYNQASIYDLRNMLTAFQWRLPNSYWQSRCKKYLIFEFDELIRNNQTVDWQFLCLRTEELFLKDGWYDGGGLKNRGRILQLLQGLKKIFLEMRE